MSESVKPGIRHLQICAEFETDERCHIIELANDPDDEAISIARARVEPGVSTAWHKLQGVSERYLIISGEGRAEIGEMGAVDMKPGDVLRIPANRPQRITNTGTKDLIFYCICTPRFTASCYIDMEKDNGFYSRIKD